MKFLKRYSKSSLVFLSVLITLLIIVSLILVFAGTRNMIFQIVPNWIAWDSLIILFLVSMFFIIKPLKKGITRTSLRFFIDSTAIYLLISILAAVFFHRTEGPPYQTIIAILSSLRLIYVLTALFMISVPMKKKIPVRTMVLFFISVSIFFILYQISWSQAPIVPLAIIQLLRVFFLILSLILLMERISDIKIYTKIFIGLILGVILGVHFTGGLIEVQAVGTAFIRIIRMIIIPLVFASLLIGTASMNPKKMGRIGLKTLSYYLAYTAFAIFIGLLLANIFQPGGNLPEDVKTQLLENYGQEQVQVRDLAQKANPVDTILNIIPINIFEGLSNGVLLQIIFFAIFFARTSKYP